MRRGNIRSLRQAIVPILLVVSVLLMFMPSVVTDQARGLVITVSEPIEMILGGLAMKAASIPRAMQSSKDIVAENEALKQQVEQMQGAVERRDYEIAQLNDKLDALEPLHRIVPSDDFDVLTGEVIARPVPLISGGTERRSVTILLGAAQGVKVDDLVTVGWEVVGKVISVGLQASEVRLITHQESRIVAQVFRREKKPGVPRNSIPGILAGYSHDRCLLEKIPGREEVSQGDWVVTAGFKGKDPKGLLLGKVLTVERGSGEHLEITVEPSVDFDRINQVVVIRRRKVD